MESLFRLEVTTFLLLRLIRINKNKIMKRILGIVFFLNLIWACSSDNEDGGSADDVDPGSVNLLRGSVLSNWADNIIIPSYEAFLVEMATMNSAFKTFKTDATAANLVSFRTSWLSAYKTWQRVAMFEIGPAESADFRFSMNTYPTDVDEIESHITSGTYNLSLSSNRDSKGFPALDYLINGLAENDDAIVLKYNATNKDALISYVDDVLADMTTLSNQVAAAWKDGYRDTFVANDGATATAAVDRFVNDYIFHFEKFVRAGKMGIPLGVFSGTPSSNRVEGFYKRDISNELFLESLQAVQDLFNGKHYGSNVTGASLASYLDALNTVKDGEDLNILINNQFNKSREKVIALSSFTDEIENSNPPTNMLLAYDEVQRLVPLFKVDMVSAMSVSIDFVDADGD